MKFDSVNPDDIIFPGKGKFKLPQIPSLLPLIIVGIIVLASLKTVFYTVEPNEVAVVTRFGRVARTASPGLHFKLPFNIERAFIVKVEYIYKEEFGFRTQDSGVRTTYRAGSYDDESLLLSGDLNVIDTEWIVQFKVRDPIAVLFHIRDIRKALRDVSEAVIRQVAGDYTFNEVITTKRIEINDIAQQEMQKILDSYGVGVVIITVKLQDVNPPESVRHAFNEVNEAKQEREKMINQAWEVYNRIIPQARGEALKIMREAEGYALEKVNMAEGDAKRFLLLLDVYNQAKDITRRRLYLENMSDILNKVGRKYIIDPKEKGILPLLRLEQ